VATPKGRKLVNYDNPTSHKSSLTNRLKNRGFQVATRKVWGDFLFSISGNGKRINGMGMSETEKFLEEWDAEH
jgi:hypothetical protein